MLSTPYVSIFISKIMAAKKFFYIALYLRSDLEMQCDIQDKDPNY